ncbi:MAG TPA: signal peptide peptidase SppA [Chloroflexi bacterium]|nr:signal peptide peptidase SppA [Chloroflexota bacterium]
MTMHTHSADLQTRPRHATPWWTQPWQWLARSGEHSLYRLSNLRRRWFKRRLPDYVVVTLDGSLLERNPETPWYYDFVPGYRGPQTLEGVRHILDRVADDPDVRGVLFLFKGASLTLAQAQSLTSLFERFRQWSRARHQRQHAQHVVVYVEQCSPSALIAASAADRLIFAPLADWEIVGLRTAPLFLKEALTRLGIEMQVVRVAPWKTAADQFIFDGLSDAAREQAQWLLDSLYADIVNGVAQGRRLEPATVQALIDRAPLTGAEALAAGLIDQLAYEDELPDVLKDGEKAAVLKPYGRVRNLLYHRLRPAAVGTVGVITLSGTIMTGASRAFPTPLPLFGDETIGSKTAQQIIRAARQDDTLDAVVVHVDSPGGSALASDLIWRELTLLAAEKPVIIYMGNVAASGGYYIAAAGRKIVAQRASLTGSIGVIIAKANLQGAFAKLGARRDTVKRGAHADIYADTTHWQDDLIERVETTLQYVYTQFKQRVIDGRGIEPAMLDEIAGGRVWTGAQAQAHGLVDALGDFDHAVELAAAEAGLPVGGRVKLVTITEPHRWLPPAPATIQALLGGRRAQQVADLTTFLFDGELSATLTREQVWLLAPHLPKS